MAYDIYKLSNELLVKEPKTTFDPDQEQPELGELVIRSRRSAKVTLKMTDCLADNMSLRPLQCRAGCLSRCDGSAQLSQGSTTMMVGLYGPADVKPHREQIDSISVQVNLINHHPKGGGGGGGVADRAKEVLIRQVVSASVMASMHPRSGLHLGLQVLEDDAGLLSCAVNATCLALIDAGFAMKSLFAGVTCAVVSGGGGEEKIGGRILLDPDSAKLRKNKVEAVIDFAFESRNLEVMSVRVEGKCSEAKFQEALSASKNASKAVFDFYREAVTKKFAKEQQSSLK